MSFPARVHLTARDDGARLTARPSLDFQPRPSIVDKTASLWVDDTRECQTIAGFGGAFTEAGAVTLRQMPGPVQEEILRAYFDPHTGHGYSLCRTHLNSCDFALGNYAYCEKDGDFDLQTFSIGRDREALIPMIQRAQEISGRGFQLFASPWSPPAWMKTNRQMNRGGQLRPECRDAWARYYARYIQEYAAEGIPIWGLTVQNEPAATQRWDSCVYSAEEERDFVRDYLGPTLHREGLAGVKLIIWDHNRDLLFERAKVVYDDPAAAKYVWGAGFHWYVADAFENVQRTHEAWPEKNLLFTEGCQEKGPHLGSWLTGERYARSIIQDLNHWTVGWVDWNMLLEINGGPNHTDNFCSAPIMADPATGKIHYQSSYYYLGHFSRFIRPQARRLLCSSSRDQLEITAAKNPDGSIAVVVLNRSEELIPFRINVYAAMAVGEAPRRSIQTIVIPAP